MYESDNSESSASASSVISIDWYRIYIPLTQADVDASRPEAVRARLDNPSQWSLVASRSARGTHRLQTTMFGSELQDFRRRFRHVMAGLGFEVSLLFEQVREPYPFPTSPRGSGGGSGGTGPHGGSGREGAGSDGADAGAAPGGAEDGVAAF